MHLFEKRMKQLKNVAIKIIYSSTIDEFETFVNLNRLIYSVRRLNNFKRFFFQTNLNKQSKSNINLSTI